MSGPGLGLPPRVAGDDEGHTLAPAGWSQGWDEDEGPPRWPRRLAVALSALAVLVLLAGLGLHWVDDQVRPPREGRAVSIRVPAGATVSGLAPVLAKRDVIGNAEVFRLYVHLKGADSLHPGVYRLHQHEPYATLLAALARPPAPTVFHLTIPEGFTLAQVAARVGKLPGHSVAHFLAVADSGSVRSPYQPPGSTSLEGLLFPDTYVFSRKASDASIITTMVDRFDQQAAAAGLDQAAARVGVSPYQALIVASIVEREAKLASDRGKVARVVYNRLKIGMPLQIDATVIYALGGSAAALAGHSPDQVAVHSPYNTYLVTGLTPTPIANPGLASIQAALAPTPGPWLYYVVVAPNGAEAFSSTYAGQQANVALAQTRGLG